MKLQDIKSNKDLAHYIEGLVNDFQGVEMPSDVTDKTIQMYKDIGDLCVFVGEKAKSKTIEKVKEEFNKKTISNF